jgi:hypothetical protein
MLAACGPDTHQLHASSLQGLSLCTSPEVQTVGLRNERRAQQKQQRLQLPMRTTTTFTPENTRNMARDMHVPISAQPL